MTADMRRRGGRAFIYLVLLVAAALFLVPLVAMVFTSLKTMPEITGGAGFETATILSPPRLVSFEAWGLAWSSACIAVACEGLRGYFWNSILLVIFAVSISVALGAVNGYVLSKWRFRGDSIIFGMLLFGCFIPFQIVLIPMARGLGLLDLAGTLGGLVLVHVCYGIPFTTLFFRNFYVTVPDELIAAGRMDGAGFWQIFTIILVPISWPIFVVAIIWQFTNVWNDFLFGASFAGPDTRPLMVALNNLVNTSTGTKAYNVDMAGAMIAALPTMLVYIVGGRYFLRGLTSGAVKG
ncbi:MAG: carbohydrate ABC transporter permease [Roseicyclus sp.]|nr:carbohydrate ABC transporter permease [Roseicyclus sp.]